MNQLQVAWLERSREDGRGRGQRVEHMLSQRRSLRITAAAKDPYCAFWGGQFTVDIITPKEYKEGITAR